ncbi:MAG: ABC transporter ATP-binding protein [Ignavibacteriaceae bacterium]|nr:ABC transporter ATP-binding protein [Ignavibacteriaceae bacterium]NUM69925.1 ABC transporter ATP-binding protein [Ignavibacteriaceae bacterium]
MDNVVRLENITKSFTEGENSRKVIDNLSFDIKKGEILVLYGRSGSGKSSLLNLIAGLDNPDSGKIFINGTDITGLNETDKTVFRRKHIGFVFQFFNLIPTLTVFENLLLPLELNKTLSAEKKEQALSLLEETGLHNRKNSFPDVLSGGEQQRIAVLRALLTDPDILLADEPTGNLDFRTAKIVIDMIDRLVLGKKKTLIMATHSRELTGIATRIFSFRDGKLEKAEL